MATTSGCKSDGHTEHSSRDADEPGNDVLIKGNVIGLQPHAQTATVNQRIGIEIQGANNTVGGLETGAGNTIAYNHTGVLVTANEFNISFSGNRILSNSIYANSDMAIDLAPLSQQRQPIVGLTSNDFGDAHRREQPAKLSRHRHCNADSDCPAART